MSSYLPLSLSELPSFIRPRIRVVSINCDVYIVDLGFIFLFRKLKRFFKKEIPFLLLLCICVGRTFSSFRLHLFDRTYLLKSRIDQKVLHLRSLLWILLCRLLWFLLHFLRYCFRIEDFLLVDLWQYQQYFLLCLLKWVLLLALLQILLLIVLVHSIILHHFTLLLKFLLPIIVLLQFFLSFVHQQ